MSPAPTEPNTSAVRKDLLGRLGLPAASDEQAVRGAHRAIVDYLDSAPDDISGWAGRRKQEADKLLSLLTGPDAALVSMARPAAPVAGGVRKKVPTLVWVVVGLLALTGVIWGVYQLGKPSDLPAMTAAQASSTPVPTVDASELAKLMEKVQANPKDTDSLNAIANLYFNAGDMKSAKAFLEKILAYDPTNQKALMGSGAISYQNKDYTSAETTWLAAAAAYPNDPEVHYDLGFVYMMTGASDKMQAEWAKVIQLAPDTDMAKNVQQHVGTVKSSASPTTGAVPTPSATPSK